MLGEINFRLLRRLVDRRMIEDDREGQLVAIIRVEARPLVAVANLDGLGDANKLLGGTLLLYACGLNQKDERRRRAIEDGHFRRIQVDPGVVDAEAGECRHQVLDGANLDPRLFQARTHARIADHEGGGGNIDRFRQIGTPEDDPAVRRSRAESHVDLDAPMQADAGGADHGLECALLEHASA